MRYQYAECIHAVHTSMRRRQRSARRACSQRSWGLVSVVATARDHLPTTGVYGGWSACAQGCSKISPGCTATNNQQMFSCGHEVEPRRFANRVSWPRGRTVYERPKESDARRSSANIICVSCCSANGDNEGTSAGFSQPTLS